MRVGVTGAGGFFGKALIDALDNASLDVVPIKLPRTAEALNPDHLENLAAGLKVDAVFHLAAIRHPHDGHEFAINAVLPALLEAALRRARTDLQFVHMSTLNTVLPDRTDSYSISKRCAETALENTGAIIIRPGLIWSWRADAGGDPGRLRKYLHRSLPFHPLPFPGPLYRPVLAEQLASRLVQLLSDKMSPSVINVTGNRPLTVWQLATMASENTRARLLPVPTAFIEKSLPRAISKHLPVALRLSDLSIPNKTIGRAADVTWTLPFSPPSKST